MDIFMDIFMDKILRMRMAYSLQNRYDEIANKKYCKKYKYENRKKMIQERLKTENNDGKY